MKKYIIFTSKMSGLALSTWLFWAHG